MTTKVTPEPATDRSAHLFDDPEPLPTPSRRLLGDLLVERGLISFADLDAALDIQRHHGGRIGEILIQEGRLTLGQVLDAVSEQCGIARDNPGCLRARLAERRS